MAWGYKKELWILQTSVWWLVWHEIGLVSLNPNKMFDPRAAFSFYFPFVLVLGSLSDPESDFTISKREKIILMR